MEEGLVEDLVAGGLVVEGLLKGSWISETRVEGKWEEGCLEGELLEDAFGFDALPNIEGLGDGGRVGRAGKSVSYEPGLS